jgi:hypothetical protein
MRSLLSHLFSTRSIIGILNPPSYIEVSYALKAIAGAHMSILGSLQ